MMNFVEKYLIRSELTLKRYRRFKRNRAAVISVFVFAFMIFVSFTAEFWANSKPHMMSYQGQVYFPLVKDYHPSLFGRTDIQVMDYRSLQMGENDWAMWPVIQWDPYESNSAVESYPAPPTKYNLFGTDDRGRDVLTRLLYGFRYTFIYAVGVWFLTYLIGCGIGAGMGYMGGRVDLIGMRLIEVFESIPAFFILITLISIFKPNIYLLVFFSMCFGWTGISHYMRGQFLSLRKREYVEAAKAIGSTHKRVILKHIMPNALTPIITLSPFAIAGNIESLSIMDYLGLGLPPPTPSWGELLGQAQSYFTTAEWLVWAPSGALVLTMTLLININLAVRDAFDAKSAVG
ncbi:ABC transporter permease subunit [Bdellovibrio sp. HCB337]|uniref:ABC transporter permease subunit n=1 Tax=Bdellovibrio sp. HCB337 TaxID=3394358 RepID=UPI0039A45369